MNGVLDGASGTIVALVVGVGLGWTIVGIPAAIYIGMKTARAFDREMARKNVYNQFIQNTYTFQDVSRKIEPVIP